MGLPIENLITPIGELQWMFITGKGKQDLNGVDKFQANIRFPVGSPEAVALAEKITTFWQDNKPKGAALKSLGFRDEREKNKEDGSKGDLTGFVAFSFWTGLTWPDGKAKVIDIYNAGDVTAGLKPTRIHLGAKTIGNGSLGCFSGAMGIYDNGPAARGVTLYIGAVQLTKFLAYSNDAGFDAADGDGYQGETTDDFAAAGAAIAEAADDTPIEGEVVNSAPKPRL